MTCVLYYQNQEPDWRKPYIGVRGSLERDISSLRALGPGGGQISRVVHVSTRAACGVFAEKCGFVQEGHTFLEKREERRNPGMSR